MSILPREIVPPKKFGGEPRQAGADPGKGDSVLEFKRTAESSLYAFCVGVLGKTWLSRYLHKDICDWLQKCPPHRKLLMLPRACCKTTIVSHSLPLHIIIQPEESNIYFPGLPGSECRILLAGEKEARANDNLRVIQSELERNELLRALWPEVCWENPRRQARKWTESECIVPRKREYPDPTIRATGVGGAITGARPNCIIKDDLISIEAANSEVVMQYAIDWHVASRALLDMYDLNTGLRSLEFIVGTHWKAYDLYTFIENEDPTVEVLKRSIYEYSEDGSMKLLWPERFDWETIKELERSFGSRFWLLYMNRPVSAATNDFDMSLIRRYTIEPDGTIYFEHDKRDEVLAKETKKKEAEQDPDRAETWTPYNSATHDRLFRRGAFFDCKYLRTRGAIWH